MGREHESISEATDTIITMPDSFTESLSLSVPTVTIPPEVSEGIAASLSGLSSAISAMMANVDLSGMTTAIETVAAYTAASLPDTSTIAASLQAAWENVEATTNIIKEAAQPIRASSSMLLDACAPLIGTSAFNNPIIIDEIEASIHPAVVEATIDYFSIYSRIEGKIIELVRTIEKKFSFCHEIIHKAYQIVQKWLNEKIACAFAHAFYSLKHILRFSTHTPRVVLHYDIREHIQSPELILARRKFMGIAPRIKEQFLRHCRERGNDSDLSDYVAFIPTTT
ncbi:hypothetical protein D6855_16045 [Butyrivibrio sp. CB08]|uniref:hypothetical protein n=1 Tax=Butyrivibrio sp. CB08 TaxID=2364879 RepID=UPI000EA96120|nr:hypothetical protein [Butyrivibrio sp. CB08]RKM55443.1 hypothetical protein D6855_16045 [Butyrivibrio sp. CB08]